MAPALSLATTHNGYLLVLAIVLPVVGILFAVAFGGRYVERLAGACMLGGLAVAWAIFATLWTSGGAPLLYILGGWAPPLGIALRADALSAVMMAITAVVVGAISVFAYADFRTPADSTEARAPFSFWILLLAIWSALNTVFVAGDLFTLYVALELVTFAAVPVVCLDGRAETLQAALRYLLFALVGSVLYLAGTVLIYGVYGTLDVDLLSQRVGAEPMVLVAVTLMTVGLLAKTALFPLYLWLPPAHAGAPAAGSAVLSALVVKASFFIVVRLWFNVMPGLPGVTAAQILGGLGAAAIVFGSILALRQERLKLLIAYSTLAQIGYLFLMFPLAFDPSAGRLESGGALTGGLLQAISHATAKAAMFMSAGLIYASLGHDRITGLGGIARALPMSVLAFALGGIALIGVPPSGAYLAKDLLLDAAAGTGQWWWDVVIQAGGIFTSGYLILVLAHAMARPDAPIVPRAPVARIREVAVLALALCSLVLGLVPWETILPVPQSILAKPLDLAAFSKLLWPILAGGVLAVLLGRWRSLPGRDMFGKGAVAIVGPARHSVLALGRLFESLDVVLRQWPAAGICVLTLTIVFGLAMLFAR